MFQQIAPLFTVNPQQIEYVRARPIHNGAKYQITARFRSGNVEQLAEVDTEDEARALIASLSPCPADSSGCCGQSGTYAPPPADGAVQAPAQMDLTVDPTLVLSADPGLFPPTVDS